ncbi:hypothetical protein Tco_0039804 [Tanacetum coccineum]
MIASVQAIRSRTTVAWRDTVDWAMQAPLRASFRNLPIRVLKEILQTTDVMTSHTSPHKVHNDLYKLYRSPPPPPPPPAGASGALGTFLRIRSSQLLPPPSSPHLPYRSGSTQQQGSKAPSLSKTAASASQSMAWTTSDTQYEPADIPGAQELSPSDYLMQDDSIPEEQVHLSDDEDSENDHQPKADSRKDWWKPLPEEERPATPEPAWTIPSSNKSDVVKKTGALTQAVLKAAYEYVKAFYPDVIHLQFQMEECHKMLTSQVDWTNPEGDHVRIDGSNPALSISKIKAASYPDFGLELLVPEQMWIDDVCTYDISAKYGISHRWFNRHKFYIDRHDSPSRKKDVRTYTRILSVIRIKAYSRYEPESTPPARSSRSSSWFRQTNAIYCCQALTLELVIRQWVEDFQLGIKSYQTQLDLTKPEWDPTGYEFKHDYTIIESPRAIVFLVDNNDQKIMMFNEIYKFSDGTSKEFIAAIERRTKDEKDLPESGMLLLVWVSNSLVHSLRALSTLRRSGLRTTSTTAKPCQGDSLEFYLIIGRIPTVTDAGKRYIDS